MAGCRRGRRKARQSPGFSSAPREDGPRRRSKPLPAFADDDQVLAVDAHDAAELVEAVVGLHVVGHRGALAAAADEERVPVGLGIGDDLGRERAGGAGAIDHDERDGKQLLRRGRDEPRRLVGAAAGREADDDLDRSGGFPALRDGGGSARAERGREAEGGREQRCLLDSIMLFFLPLSFVGAISGAPWRDVLVVDFFRCESR